MRDHIQQFQSRFLISIRAERPRPRRRPPRHATVDTTNLVINHGTQRQPVEAGIHALPDDRTQLVPKSMLALPQKTSVAIVLLPPINVARLVVAPQQPDLLRFQAFQR